MKKTKPSSLNFVIMLVAGLCIALGLLYAHIANGADAVDVKLAPVQSVLGNAVVPIKLKAAGPTTFLDARMSPERR